MRANRLAAVVALAGCATPPATPPQGCWVHAFAGEEPYRPPLTTYTGPTYEPVFMRNARSLMVGPGARLETRRVVLGPGARVGDLAALGLDPGGEPFQLRCEGSGP